MKPVVSVIMCLYNEPIEWLEESVNSILAQTFVDFEFIIINDNPARHENKTFLLAQYQNDKRILIIENEINIGLTKSLNKGLQAAKGTYIARMDADDIAMPNRFAVQKEFLEIHPDYVACGSSIFRIVENKKTYNLLYKPVTNEEINSWFFFESPIIHPTLFFRKMGGGFLLYDESFRNAQDYEYISRLITHGKLYNFPEPLLYYRFSNNQITSKNLVYQNQLALKIRAINLKNYLKKQYGIEISHVFSKNTEALADKVIDFLKDNKNDRNKLSAILYSVLFYSDMKLFYRIYYILKSQLLISIRRKYRIRLLLSIFMKFKDQKFS